VYTTIGYGHYAPVTDEGRAAVMLYALLGIPMLLALLADLGKLLTGFLNAVWTRFRQSLAFVTTVNQSAAVCDRFWTPDTHDSG